MEKLISTKDELAVVVLEVEAVWGESGRKVFTEITKVMSILIMLLTPNLGGKDSQGIRKEFGPYLTKGNKENINDPITEELEAVIKEAEGFFKPKLRLR